jgi:hypothetical protein
MGALSEKVGVPTRSATLYVDSLLQKAAMAIAEVKCPRNSGGVEKSLVF